jgi:hypothetical protein
MIFEKPSQENEGDKKKKNNMDKDWYLAARESEACHAWLIITRKGMAHMAIVINFTVPWPGFGKCGGLLKNG